MFSYFHTPLKIFCTPFSLTQSIAKDYYYYYIVFLSVFFIFLPALLNKNTEYFLHPCQWAAAGRGSHKITVRHNSHFLSSQVFRLRSAKSNCVLCQWSAPCHSVPLPISSAWQIISGCRNGFWSRPVPPEFPCHSLFRQDGDCRRKCERDSRGSYTVHSYFSSHLGWGWLGEGCTLSCTYIESKHSAQKTALAALHSHTSSASFRLLWWATALLSTGFFEPTWWRE